MAQGRCRLAAPTGLALVLALGGSTGARSQQARPDPAQGASSPHSVEDFHAAELAWRELARREPRNLSAHNNLGVTLAQQGLLAAAAAEYHTSLGLDPHQPEVSYDLGLAEFKQGHFVEAITAFNAVAREQPDDPRTPVLLGMSYFGLRRYADAARYLKSAADREPANMQLHTVLAQSCLWGGDYDCALARFQHIVEVNPDSVEAHMLTAEALDGLGRTEDAIQELEAAARLVPQQPLVHFELGYLHYKKGNFDQASQELKIEIRNNPGYAQAYAYLGDISFRANDTAAALPLLDKAVELDNQMRLGWFDLGCIYADQKTLQPAIDAFKRSVSLDPNQPDAHYRLARLYTQLGDRALASQEFARTRELHSKAEDTLIQKVSGSEQPPAPK